MNEEERRKTEGTVGYLLDQLQKIDLGKDNNPLRTVACLFTLKSTLEKWLTPRLAFWCLERDIRAALMTVLSRGVKPHDGQDEALVHSLAMETLWLLSGVGHNTVDAMLTWSGLFDMLSRYLDISGGFYHFGPGVQQHLHDLRCRGPFPQQRVTAVPLSDKTWSDLLRYMPSMRAWGRVRPSHLYRCHLSCPTEGETREPIIAARLVSQGLAWTLLEDKSTGPSPLFTTIEGLTHPSCNRTAQSSPRSDHDDHDAQSVDSSREDVHVLEAVGGHYFWAHIGSQAADTVKNIAEALSAAWPKLQTCRPGVGDVIAVLGKRSGVDEPVAMRGKVLEVSKDEVTVFAMDYGKVERVHVCDVYGLPEPHGHLSCLAGQAKLCCLAGVRAPPVSVSAVEFALATLTNLTQRCSTAGVKLVDLGVVDHLDLLLTCGHPNLHLQATRLLCNISPVPEISAAVDWSRFIRPLLESLVEPSRRQCLHQELDNLQRNLVVVTLFALANLLHQKPASHQLLFDLQGHIIVLNVLRLFRPHQMVRQAAIGVLKVIYPGMVHTPDHHESGRACETAKRQEERTSSECQRVADVGGNNGKKKKEKEKSAEKQPGNSRIGVSSSTSNSRDVSEQTSELDKAVGLVPVDGASVLGEKNRFYVYDTCCPYQDDQTHHLLHVSSIRAVGFETILEIICGMLNSAGGTIFIGLTKKGQVQGVTLDRADRDCVRLGVDEMMLKTLPSIPFNQLQVDYLPVMRKTWDGKLEPNGNTFVIEIHVKTPEELQFYVHRGVCHHRVGVVNHALSEQEVRELAIGQEEIKYLPHLESLRRQVLQLQD